MIYIIILLFLFFLLKPNQNGLEFWPYVPVALIGSIFGLIITLYRSWCLARQKHLSAVFMSLVLFVLVTTISLIFVAYLHWGAFGRIAGVATGTAVISIVLAFGPLRSVAIPKWDWQVLRPMLAFGIPIIPHSFAMVVVATSDRILIERFVGLQEAGRYTVAYTFTGILAMLIQSINSSWTPRYYTERNSKKGDVVIRRYIRLWTAVFALILPLFAWCGPPVFRLMAGPSYASFSNLLAPLAVGVFFMGTYQFSINSLFYAKKSLVVPIVSGIAAIMSVLLNILFIPHWGAQAAAYNSVASYAGLTVLAWWLSRKENPQADQLRTDFLWFIAIALVTLVPWSIFDLIVSAGLYLFWCGLVIYAFRTQLLTLGTHTHPPP
jgi:O-antigen/teichoic acid export membrane protein